MGCLRYRPPHTHEHTRSTHAAHTHEHTAAHTAGHTHTQHTRSTHGATHTRAYGSTHSGAYSSTHSAAYAQGIRTGAHHSGAIRPAHTGHTAAHGSHTHTSIRQHTPAPHTARAYGSHTAPHTHGIRQHTQRHIQRSIRGAAGGAGTGNCSSYEHDHSTRGLVASQRGGSVRGGVSNPAGQRGTNGPLGDCAQRVIER